MGSGHSQQKILGEKHETMMDVLWYGANKGRSRSGPRRAIGSNVVLELIDW